MNLSILKPMNSQNVPTVGTKRPNENINENTIKRSKSNHQKKNVVNFCEENGIQYIPVVVRIVEKNGKKTKALKGDFLGMPDVLCKLKPEIVRLLPKYNTKKSS